MNKVRQILSKTYAAVGGFDGIVRTLNSSIGIALLASLFTGGTVYFVKSQAIQVEQLQTALSLANSVSQQQEATNQILESVSTEEVQKIITEEVSKIELNVVTDALTSAAKAVATIGGSPETLAKISEISAALEDFTPEQMDSLTEGVLEASTPQFTDEEVNALLSLIGAEPEVTEGELTGAFSILDEDLDGIADSLDDTNSQIENVEGDFSDFSEATADSFDSVNTLIDLANSAITSLSDTVDSILLTLDTVFANFAAVDAGFSDVNTRIDGVIAQDVPVGTVLCSFTHLANVSIPENYAFLDGQGVVDAESPFNGFLLPDVNGEGRFLRGGLQSGIELEDTTAVNGLTIGVFAAVFGTGNEDADSGGFGSSVDFREPDAVSDMQLTMTGDAETAPDSVSCRYIIKIK